MPGNRHVLTLLAALALAAGVVPASAAQQAASRKPPRPVSLQASNFRFCAASASLCLPERDDATVTMVRVGTRVTWTYTDHACDALVVCPGHNVVFTNGKGSPKLVKGQGHVIARMTFTRPGRYSYFCTAHQSFGMTGTIVVTKH